MMYIIPFVAVLVASSTSAFTSPIHHSFSRNLVPSISIPTRSNNVLQMADDSDDNTPRKRRKRKDGQQFSPPSSSTTVTEKKDDIVEVVEVEVEEEAVQDTQTTTPKENVVVMQVRDIQDVVNGAPEAPKVIEERVTVKREEVLDDDDDDELADDEEWEYYDVDEDGNEIIVSEEQEQYMGRGGQDESIEQLLADARSMRKSSSKDYDAVDEETPLKEKILGVVANIVTVDFFVVIALLLWFLAGIFCSYVLKDDTVQIAFNMNFERVTQP